jgi:hypothetical protein
MFFTKQFESYEAFGLQPIVLLCEGLTFLVELVGFLGDPGSELIFR